MSDRILVLSASAGAGHVRAAEAVLLALRELNPGAMVRHVDVLQLTNAAFRRVYGQAYLDLVNKAPHVLGYIYDLMDRPPSPRLKTDRMRLALEKINLGPFLDFLRSEEWDLAINTHFLPAEIIASLKRAHRLPMPQMTVTTDFDTHRLWVNQPCEHYFTATAEGAAYLEYWGVPAKDISVTGIPIHPAFSHPTERRRCLERHGLGADRPVLLQLAGGFGVGPIESIFRGILDIPTALEVVVVTGRNAAAKAKLEQVKPPSRHRVKIVGYTTEMHDYMTAADVVVTKPGGLTTSEVLASGAAMVIVNPIPGQESRNSDFLLENGAAIKVNNIATLTLKIESLLSDSERLAGLRRNARLLARPQAAYDIARRALAWPRPLRQVAAAPRKRVARAARLFKAAARRALP